MSLWCPRIHRVFKNIFVLKLLKLPKKTDLSCRQIHFRNAGVCRSEIWGASFQVCLLTDLSSTHPNFNTSTESIQSNLFLAVSCYNSTEKVKGCIWARCQEIFCWYCTKEFIGDKNVLYLSVTVFCMKVLLLRKTFLSPSQTGLAFFVFIQAPWRSSHL